MTAENKLYFQAEKGRYFLDLTGIGDKFTQLLLHVTLQGSCGQPLERLQQGECLIVQDVKTNLFWEFGKFTSRDGEFHGCLLLRFYKLMFELTRNKLASFTNASECSIYLSLHTRFGLLYLKDRHAPSYKQSSSHEQLRLPDTIGKEIAKQLLLKSESVSVEVGDPDKLGGIRICRRNWHPAMYFKDVYKLLPTTTLELLQTPRTRLKIPHQGVPLQAKQADWLEDTDEEIDEQELEAHYSYMAKDKGSNLNHYDTYVLEKDDSNVIPDSSNICTNDIVDQNASECVDERAALANLIANLTLDNEENKRFNAIKKAKLIDSRTEGTKQTELEKYTALNDLTSEYKILQSKLNETLGLLAIKDIDIQKGLKTKTYEISVVNQKYDELVKKSLLTRSQFEGQLKEKTKVISDLKIKEGKDHHVSTKCATYHDLPNGERQCSEKESRSNWIKDTVKPFNYNIKTVFMKLPNQPSKPNLDQLDRAKKLGRQCREKRFVRPKPNIA
ncbi:hypothetical protein Tco_0067018 [Tanacetum coccineum]